MSRDPLGYVDGLSAYGGHFAGMMGTDYLGLWTASIKFPKIKSPRIDMLLFWFQIEVQGSWEIDVAPGVSKANCPTLGLGGVKPVMDFKKYGIVGVEATVGAAGPNFKMLVGMKFGISTQGDSLLAQILNLSIDKGYYYDVSANLQYWFPGFTYKGEEYACACVTYKVKAEFSVTWGGYGARALVAAFVAGAIIEPTPLGEAALAATAASLAIAPPMFGNTPE